MPTYRVKRVLTDTVYVEADSPEEAKNKAEWDISAEEGQCVYIRNIESVEKETD